MGSRLLSLPIAVAYPEAQPEHRERSGQNDGFEQERICVRNRHCRCSPRLIVMLMATVPSCRIAAYRIYQILYDMRALLVVRTSSLVPMQSPLVLVVDDDEPQRRLLYDLLSRMGYRVLLADSGTCGIAIACQERPDLILLDIRLPDMSGLEVAGVLKASPETSSIPIAAVTALAMPGDERAIRESGCDAYMAKPVRIEQLLKLVAGLLCGGTSSISVP